MNEAVAVENTVKEAAAAELWRWEVMRPVGGPVEEVSSARGVGGAH